MNMGSTVGNSIFKTHPVLSGVTSKLKAEHATKQDCKLPFSHKFPGEGLKRSKLKTLRENHRVCHKVMYAVLATDPSSELACKFNFDPSSELQVFVQTLTSGSATKVDFQITNGCRNLSLHWGAIKERKTDWALPSKHPNGTYVYKDRALRTPFVRSGSHLLLSIEIDEPEIEAIEFLMIDETQNKWFKNNGGNFKINLPRTGSQNANISAVVNQSISLPEDLVQINAYLRWERMGKQTYSADQEKQEYEAARTELLHELNNGTSLTELRQKLAQGSIETEVTKELHTGRYLTTERIQQNRRDVMQSLGKNPHKPNYPEENIPSMPKISTAMEVILECLEEQDGDSVLNKNIFKFGDKELLVLVSNASGKTKVYLATDQDQPLALHWALSTNHEWMLPPSDVLPPNSTVFDKSCETPFVNASLKGISYKTIEINIEGGEFKGMPFVLRSGESWIKNGGSDFFMEFSTRTKNTIKDADDGSRIAKSLLDRIAELEHEAQKSFMHRFNIAAALMEQNGATGKLGLSGMLVWMRFMATRQLIWNKNYNVKPREISMAQNRLTSILESLYQTYPQSREILRLIISTVGRGGEGDVGQRIRDEILVIQRNNDCNGGMIEEWHQKLHNNTSPDDVIICQALIDYITNNFNINNYWDTLNKNGITKERLLSYDRAIHSEPHFRTDQKDGLLHDLGNYLRTLKAVHSGADLESAVTTCMGYNSEGQGFMVGVQINPIRGLPTGFSDLLRFILEHVEDKTVEPLLEGLLEARTELKPLLLTSHERLKDLIFLDIALDSTVRTATERGYEELNWANPEKIMYRISLVLENLILSSDDNEDLICCIKGWNHALEMLKQNNDHWALYAKSVLDRTQLALSSKAELYHQLLQPSAEYLGTLLGIDQCALSMFTEEIIRSGSAASLSALINRLDPVLRKLANLGSWQVISPVEVAGYIVVVDELLTVQNKSYEQPTILVAKSVKGEEEIPDGTVAVLTPDMPDVLSHVSVRARNSKVCFASCFDQNILAELQAKEGSMYHLKPTCADIIYCEIKENELYGASSANGEDGQCVRSISLVKKQFSGKYAISSEEFTDKMVGAKSRNLTYLKGKAPSWVGIPTSVALPFGVFEKVLSDDANKAVASDLQLVIEKLQKGESDALAEIRRTVLRLAAPPQLVQELKETMQGCGMPWPGDEGEQRWEQAWLAIRKVWASKWNERAYFSTYKAKLDHNHLCMAVLIQEIITADYAFVIHTTNPSTGNSSEIYAEVVKGLGETLVGAYPGRALSFVCNKNCLDSPKLVGYPSKPVGLFIRRSVIFRSDSNGEDLEGYAGAGLYDSVPMDEEEKVVLDYTIDPLIVDSNFRKTILCSIAKVGNEVEKLYGTPQDIEGVIKDGKIFVVQTRPQM